VILSSLNFLEFSSVMISHYRKNPKIVSSILNGFLRDPGVEVVYPIPRILQRFIELLEATSRIFPPDLFLAATALEYEVDYVVTDDRDFEKIKGIKVYNPFI
ncbi:PIN domain-containing protein, partial [Candidatus Microgenomates bacterium]|nr:PIN domain-containing protein [Candidatus Microgenomates bacterium]